jgi:hypothetical protein
LVQFSKNYRTFYRDTRSGINLFRIPDPGPGVKKAPDPGSATLAKQSASVVTVALPLRGHPEVGSGSRQGGQLPVEVILARVHVDEKVALAAVQPLHQSEGRAIVDRSNTKKVQYPNR